MRWTIMCLRFVDPYRQVTLYPVWRESADAPCVSGMGNLCLPGLETAQCMLLEGLLAG